MARKNKPDENEIFVESSPLSPEDERLDKLFDEMEQGSLKTLEDAARQIIMLGDTQVDLSGLTEEMRDEYRPRI